MLRQPQTSKPYLRWWWLSGPFREADIRRQLQWVEQNGFGGVELAWIDPSWLEEPARSASRPAFLGEDWSRLVAFAKHEAEALGLGCDFTFGSSWPFAGSWLRPEDSAQTFHGSSEQRVRGTWEDVPSERVSVLDHLSATGLQHYAEPLLRALKPALTGRPSALFCDSLEIATEDLWSPLLWDEFAARFGYRLEPFQHAIEEHPDVRYDYRKLIGEAIRREFYQPFTALCHDHGAYSRVQCHGAPTDLLPAYAAVDVPESEALLFLPPFSRIAASAAAWTGNNVVSAEAFTCLHGFPGWDDLAEELWQEERAGDLKLLADSLFANGVNQLVWHGMPYRPEGGDQEFYAAVHVGPDSPFAPSLPALNAYFAQVCGLLREGQTYTCLGVYLPNEDALMQGRIAEDERTPGANHHWEMRHAQQSPAFWGYAPVWISLPFLREAICEEGVVISRSLRLKAISIAVEWLDGEAVSELRRLAEAGAPILWNRKPRQPGRQQTPSYEENLSRAMRAAPSLTSMDPLLSVGGDSPAYCARRLDKDLLLFFAHPHAKRIGYPMPHRFSDQAIACSVAMTVHWSGHCLQLPLHFGVNQGLMIRVAESGIIGEVELPTVGAPE